MSAFINSSQACYHTIIIYGKRLSSTRVYSRSYVCFCRSVRARRSGAFLIHSLYLDSVSLLSWPPGSWISTFITSAEEWWDGMCVWIYRRALLSSAVPNQRWRSGWRTLRWPLNCQTAVTDLQQRFSPAVILTPVRQKLIVLFSTASTTKTDIVRLTWVNQY